MPRTNGDITKNRILRVAERLFSESGFNGTGIDKISRNAGINKGSIYYHFKDKNDILESLFQEMVDEIESQVNVEADGEGDKPDSKELENKEFEDKIKTEIKYLSEKKRVLSILLMETLKSDNRSDHLIKYLEAHIKKDLSIAQIDTETGKLSDEEIQKHMVHEFFTGMMPVICFILLKDKWCEYFGCDEEKLSENFMEAFTDSHMKSHKNK
jgi:AcrR family transcriptional regulator